MSALEELQQIEDWVKIKEKAALYDYDKPPKAQWKDEAVLIAIAALIELEERATQAGYVKPPELKWTDSQVEEAVSALEEALTSLDKDNPIEETVMATETTEKATAEPVKKDKKEKPDFDKQGVVGKYATEKLKKRKVAVCDECGGQLNNTPGGQAICPENFSENRCPRLKAIAQQLKESAEDFMDQA